MAVNILADVVNNHKVSLVMDIVLIDSLNRVAIFY
jgi:archaellum biogenesis ATPase FlaH